MRMRKLVGTVLLLLWVAFYALLAMTFLVGRVNAMGPLAQLGFYALAGVAWLPPAMLIIWWMARKPQP